MSKYPVAERKRALRERPVQAVEVVDVDRPVTRLGTYATFSYSYTELSSVGGKTRVKSRQTRLQDGKLVSESFDGELEAGVFERAVAQMSEQIAQQVNLLMRPLAWLLPASGKTGSGER